MPDIFDEIKKGNINFVQEFIDNGGDVNTLNNDGESLLFAAIFNGRVNIIRLLIENGADINFINEVGMRMNLFDPCCPLGVAVNMQNIEIARMLIENGANVDPSQFFKGITGEASEEQIKNFQKYSIIHDLFCQNMVYSKTPDDFDMYLLLINNGINLHLGNTRSPNVIFSAMSHFEGEAERIIENIFHMGTLNINEVINGRHLCDFYNLEGYEIARLTPRILNIFFSSGVDINLRNREGETLLHFVARGGNSKIVTALLSAGADHTIINNDGDTPLDIAREYKNTEVIETLSRTNLDNEFQEPNSNKRKSAYDSNDEVNTTKRMRDDEGEAEENSDNSNMKVDEQNDDVFYPAISQATANSISRGQDEIEFFNSFEGLNHEHTQAVPAALEVNMTINEMGAFDSFALFDFQSNYYL